MATNILRQYLAGTTPNPDRNAFNEGLQSGALLRRQRFDDEQNELARAAGGVLAQGDIGGAAGVLAQGGDIRNALALQGVQADRGAAAQAQREKFGERFGQFAGGVLSLPEEQQEAAYRAGIGQFEREARGLGIRFEPGPMNRDALRGIAARYGTMPGMNKGAAPRYDLDITEVIGPNNERSFFRTTTDGRFEPVKLPPGARIAPKLQLRDTGTGYIPIDPGTGRPAGPEVPKTADLSPDQRAVRDESGQVTAAEPVPGSKLDIEQQNERADKERQRLVRAKMLKQAGQTVLRSVTRALDDYLPEIAQGDGTLAAASRVAQSKIIGTDEYNLVRQITDFQRNIGIDKLQQMRESSPTGGALGQVPVQQQIMLQETLGSFDIGQPPETIKENLRQLNNIYLDIMFGSPEERAVAIRDGTMTPEQNAEIERMYYPTEFNEFGRRGGAGTQGAGGGRTASPAQPQPAAGAQPPDAAIQFLMQNPGTAEQFNAKYGEGAAQRILGGR